MTELLAQQAPDWQSLGIIPEITWQPTDSLTYASVISGAWDSVIIDTADQLKAYGSTVFLRPFHEFNGHWYTWGLPNQGADAQADTDFIAAWQHMVNLFRAQGATNVKFVWCYSAGHSKLLNSVAWDAPGAAYPGDAYVDWISFDAYNFGSLTDGKPWYTFDDIVLEGYTTAVAISPNKPVSLSELASNEYGDGGAMKSGWVNEMLYELHSPTNPYPNLRLISWFEPNHDGYNYNEESTSPTYTTFANALRVTLPDGTMAFRSNATALANLTTP
jgi:hypothetical protein